MRVLLAEDDPMIGAAISGSLRDAAYAVDWLRDGSRVLSALAVQPYSALLLDLGLPGMDGQDILQVLRAHHANIPVLILTARDALSDRVRGLDAGADDYLIKPFAMAELLARLRAVLRRQGGSGAPLLSNGLLTLDPASCEVTVRGGTPQRLTQREFALLRALLTRPGAILSRSDLEERIYGWGEEVESNAVEYLIHVLRKKLGGSAIINVRGLGWMVSKSA